MLCEMRNPTNEMPHAKCYMQNATCEMQHAKCYMRNATCEMLHAAKSESAPLCMYSQCQTNAGAQLQFGRNIHHFTCLHGVALRIGNTY